MLPPLKCTYFRIKLIENLRNLEGAPGVALSEVPPDTYLGSDDEDEADPDIRISRMCIFFFFGAFLRVANMTPPEHDRDRDVAHEAELSDSDDEDGRRDYDMYDEENH